MSESRQLLETLSPVSAVIPAGEETGWLRVELVNSPDGQAAEDLPIVKNRILEALIRADIPIQGFEVGGGRLQDVFLQLTEEGIE